MRGQSISSRRGVRRRDRSPRRWWRRSSSVRRNWPSPQGGSLSRATVSAMVSPRGIRSTLRLSYFTSSPGSSPPSTERTSSLYPLQRGIVVERLVVATDLDPVDHAKRLTLGRSTAWSAPRRNPPGRGCRGNPQHEPWNLVPAGEGVRGPDRVGVFSMLLHLSIRGIQEHKAPRLDVGHGEPSVRKLDHVAHLLESVQTASSRACPARWAGWFPAARSDQEHPERRQSDSSGS